MESIGDTARATEKALLRTRIRTARAAMTEHDRARQAADLAREVLAFLAGLPPINATPGAPGAPSASSDQRCGTLAAYLGLGTEPDTTPLLTDAHRLGYDVVVPVCEPVYALSWAAWAPGVPLVRSPRASVVEPAGPRRRFEDIGDVALMVVPALCVDGLGYRLGQGGGYYDRFLAQPSVRGSGVRSMGMVYRSELLPAGALPAETFDQPLDGVITADGALLLP